MTEADRIDRGEHGRDDEAPSASPIIIVQRGRSGWGRELLLLLLLLTTASYIVYQEYRGPAIIVQNSPRLASREIDSVPSSPVSRGDVVLRASDTESSPTSDDRSTAPAESPEPAIDEANERPDGARSSRDEPVEEPEPPADATEVEEPETSQRSPFDLEVDDEDLDVHQPDPETPKRSSSTIVWDEDRRDRPVEEFRRPLDREREQRPAVDEGAARVVDQRPALQSLAQRRLFHQGLVRAIRQYGRHAGPHIDGLCRDSHARLPAEVMQLEHLYGPTLILGGSNLESSVVSLRKIGAPEGYLLEQITEQMTRTIGARRGPRDLMEARVFAARKLLAIPLPASDDEQAFARQPALR